MKRNPQIRGLLLLSVAVLLTCSCANQKTALRDAFDIKKTSATQLAQGLGLPTVWDTIVPCEVGIIYQRYVRPPNAVSFSTFSDLYPPLIASVKETKLETETWSFTVSNKQNVALQLSYMGISGNGSFDNTKSITFTAQGDTYDHITKQITFFSILNDSAQGDRIRAAIIADTKSRIASKLGNQASKYWVVTQRLNAKGFTVTFNSKPDSSVKVSVADAAQVAAWAGFPTNSLGAESFSVGASGDTSASITATDSVTLIAECVPLLWNSSSGQIEADFSKPLVTIQSGRQSRLGF
jgi:hypothetical protein